MRHLKSGRKLNRTSSHRRALLSNLSCSLIQHKQIITTLPKAKELKNFIERLVTYAKKGGVHGRRLIMKKIKGNLKKEVSNILIHEIAPNYLNRNGGYTRIIKLNSRKNDDAKLSLIEFVDLKSTQNDSSNEKDNVEVSDLEQESK